jgi:hypothetical protein
MIPLITAIINTLVPFKAAADAGSVPVPSAGTVVSPVTTITNAVVMFIGAVLTIRGVDAGTASTIAAGVVGFGMSLLNQLHLNGAANLNTLAQNPTQPAKDQNS